MICSLYHLSGTLIFFHICSSETLFAFVVIPYSYTEGWQNIKSILTVEWRIIINNLLLFFLNAASMSKYKLLLQWTIESVYFFLIEFDWNIDAKASATQISFVACRSWVMNFMDRSPTKNRRHSSYQSKTVNKHLHNRTECIKKSKNSYVRQWHFNTNHCPWQS